MLPLKQNVKIAIPTSFLYVFLCLDYSCCYTVLAVCTLNLDTYSARASETSMAFSRIALDWMEAYRFVGMVDLWLVGQANQLRIKRRLQGLVSLKSRQTKFAFAYSLWRQLSRNSHLYFFIMSIKFTFMNLRFQNRRSNLENFQSSGFG